MYHTKQWLILGLVLVLGGCAAVGPDFQPPEEQLPSQWVEEEPPGFDTAPSEQVDWWKILNDPVLDDLVATARLRNTTLELAGLRVMEAQAQLGIASGAIWPQTQVATGRADYVSPPENTGVNDSFWQLSAGVGVNWEIDFWGRFRRGIESADAAFMASIAAYDQAMVLMTAAVVDTYTVIRSIEEQLRISRENVVLQQRSYDIAEVLYSGGADSELDMQQAQTLLLSTEASIPQLEIALTQAQNALSILLNETPGGVRERLSRGGGIPNVPQTLTVGVPADMLRRRPDVRQAEFVARAQNAAIGLAKADLYPSFSLAGSIGLASTTAGDADFGDLFSGDALTWSIGPSFVWPFLNYGRIKNNVRVQDARLQQALVRYHDTVLQAAREAEDSMAALIGTRKRDTILGKSVASAKRSSELSTVRYSEGFSDYERVLSAQRALFAQQQRFATNQGDIVRAMISLYKALGGGWEDRKGLPYVAPETLEVMENRTDWGEMIEDRQTNNGD